MDNIKIGKTIKELRINKGLSQGDVAKICNITAPAVSKWERGESIPDISSLECLSHLFGVTINEIINSRAEIKVTSSKNILYYRIGALVLAIAIIILGFTVNYYYGQYKAILDAPNTSIDIQESDELKAFIEISDEEYHIYYEETLYKFVRADIVDWVDDVFIQNEELYNYFTSENRPSLNDIRIDTTDMLRVNNETSTITVSYEENSVVYEWEIDVTYYDINGDEDYARLNGGRHITSNGNEYEFDVYDDGYFVLYELLNGSNLFNNYYSHITDMSPRIIDENIQIDYEINRLGMDIIFTDNNEVTKYHYIFTENQGGHSSWYIGSRPGMITYFTDETLESELQFLNFTDDGEFKVMSFLAFRQGEQTWDYEITVSDYLEHVIDHELIDFKITYQLQNDGLLHIVFERSSDGHIMSYKILPNELD